MALPQAAGARHDTSRTILCNRLAGCTGKAIDRDKRRTEMHHVSTLVGNCVGGWVGGDGGPVGTGVFGTGAVVVIGAFEPNPTTVVGADVETVPTATPSTVNPPNCFNVPLCI